MSNFSFTGTALCAECGKYTKGSHSCVESEPQEYLFKQIGSAKEYVVTATSQNAAWRKVALNKEEPISWISYGLARVKRTKPVETAAAYFQAVGDLQEL